MSQSAVKFDAAYSAFADYTSALRKLNAAMCEVGIETINVDPMANFAEVIVARHFNGTIQPATNKGFDVLCDDGRKIQVKSLKVSSAKPEDNPLNWYTATREHGKRDRPLIDAALLTVIVYRDSIPYAQLTTPVVLRDSFPVIEVKDLYIRHVDKLLDAEAEHPELHVSRIKFLENANS